PSDQQDLHSFPTRRSSDLSKLNKILQFTYLLQNLHHHAKKSTPVNFLSSFSAQNIYFTGSIPLVIIIIFFSGAIFVIKKRIDSTDRKSTRLNSSHVKISYA